MVYRVEMEWVVGDTTDGKAWLVELTNAEAAEFRTKYEHHDRDDTVWYTIEELDETPELDGLKALEAEISATKNKWH